MTSVLPYESSALMQAFSGPITDLTIRARIASLHRSQVAGMPLHEWRAHFSGLRNLGDDHAS